MMDQKPKRHFTVQLRKIQNETYLICKQDVFKLDEIGLLIWDACDGTRTVAEIGNQISARFTEVDASEIQNDTLLFVNELVESGLVKLA